MYISQCETQRYLVGFNPAPHVLGLHFNLVHLPLLISIGFLMAQLEQYSKPDFKNMINHLLIGVNMASD